MSCSAAQTKPQTTASVKKRLVPGSLTLMPASFTPGATPATPSPLRGEAIVPATCVPWSLPSVYGRQAPSDESATPPTQLADWDLEKFGARSGWVSSTPVSITPTVTSRLPSLTLAALSAPMARMSHWFASSGS